MSIRPILQKGYGELEMVKIFRYGAIKGYRTLSLSLSNYGGDSKLKI
jgi:hypothetical protein